MKVMILAAGRGLRMRPLTDDLPKPLLKAGGTPLIVRLIRQLKSAGYADLVINHAWLGQKLVQELKNGHQLGVNIQWSAETEALETAGGIGHALQWLGNEPFAVINADIVTDFDFDQLEPLAQRLVQESLKAVCVLVPNPEHHPEGDFGLSDELLLTNDGQTMFTFAGIGVYSPTLFKTLPAATAMPLAPILREQASINHVGAFIHRGMWSDVGTPERLRAIDQTLANQDDPI